RDARAAQRRGRRVRAHRDVVGHAQGPARRRGAEARAGHHPLRHPGGPEMKHALLVAGLLAAWTGVAHAERARVTGVVFAAPPVRTPVAPDAVLAEAPFVPANVPERTGTLALGPAQAAAFWLDPLDVVRVR